MSNNMNKTVGFVIAIIAVIFIVSLLGPWFTLKETEIAVITQFGKPKKTVENAGLHFKTPIIDKINYLPKRILDWDGAEKQFPTYDKRMLLVDTTVRWRIKDPLAFFEIFTNEAGALGKLDDILEGSSKQVVSRHKFEELVRTSARINNLDERTVELLMKQGFTREDLDSLPTIDVGRNSLALEMKKDASQTLNNYGIEVIDFFVKKVNYIAENEKSVFESMIAERNKIAQAYRSEGEQRREEILGDTDRDTKQVLAEGQERSKEIMGEADAEAAKIYNSSYNRNAATRDFYEFVKKMEMYKTIPSNTSMIITTDSEFFDMFKKY